MLMLYTGGDMQIVKLVLHNYKRLFLNGITHVVYEPNSKTQIILGQNGSGKSSLLEQLTPISANIKKDFNDGGYREITLLHNDITYTLHNRPNGKHSFLLDTEELNDGGTLSVQNKLVEYHFGITPHIQQVLLGKNQFCNMSPSERKKWITDISTIDYSYPITVYNALKQRHRDVVGGIKLLQNNIVRVKESSLHPELISNLVGDKKHLLILIDYLLTLIDNTALSGNIDNVITDLTNTVADVNKLSGKVVGTDLVTLTNKLITAKSKQDMLNTRLVSLYTELDKLTDIESMEDKDVLIAKLASLVEESTGIRNNNIFGSIDDIEFVYTYVNDNYSNIVGLLSKLTEHQHLNTSKSRMVELLQIKSGIESSISFKERALYKLEERLEHLEHHLKEGKSITCPKCSNTWVPTYTESEYTGYTTEITLLTKSLTELNTNLDTVNKELETIEVVRGIVSEFVKYLSLNDNTKLILKYIVNHDNYIKDKINSLFYLFEFVHKELTELYKVVGINNKISEIKAKLVIIEHKDILRTELDNATKSGIEADIHNIRTTLISLSSDVDTLTTNIGVKKNYLDKLTTLSKDISNVYTTKNSLCTVTRNTCITKGVSELRLLLLDIDTKLSKHTECETMLHNYQTELDEYNNIERVIKLVLKELSPSEGLIAKSINSFLNYFIQDMNNIIANIWGYDMEILECNLGDSDLDYKFRVLVNNDEIVEDISKTSSSMQEMINLVFKIVFSKYKGFINYPLILDELGRTFDATHRVTMYEALERYISNDFSQVYIVSHFESMYGRFGNADISVLGTTGVELNTVSEYNEVMKLS